MKTRTQNFDVPLNSSSVPSQMFALSEGQTYFSWPAVHRSTSSGEKKTCRHRERRAMISFIILCLWRKSGTQLQTVSPGRLSLRCIRLLTLKKKRKTIKREPLSHLCTVCIVVVWAELVWMLVVVNVRAYSGEMWGQRGAQAVPPSNKQSWRNIQYRLFQAHRRAGC